MAKKKVVFIGVASALIILFSEKAYAEETTIRILHTNDAHGRAFEGELDGIGYAKLKTLIDENRGEHSLLVDAGDTFHGTTFASLEEGRTIADVLNTVGYDAFVPGNHDFNYGLDRLYELEETIDFPVIAANLLNDEEEPLFEPFMLQEFDDVTVGIFGLATPETAFKTHPNNVAAVTFEDPSAAAQRMVDLLQQEGADVIIALAHLGIDETSEDTSQKVAAEVQEIDVIIDGHSHSELPTGLIGENNTLIASAGEYLQNLGVVDLVFADGVLVEKNAKLIQQSEAEAIEPDEKVEALLAELEEGQQAILAEPVGQTAVDLNGEREHVRVEETNLGNFIADVLRNATEADIALTNGGGIRASVQAGMITKGDLVEVSPFGNYAVTVEVTGAQLLKVLENGVSGYPEPSGGFPQISGFSFQFDPNNEPGQRVHSVLVKGKPLQENETYLLATNDFLAAGGDEYTDLANAPIVNEFSAVDELLIEYLQDAGEIAPKIEGRIQMAATPAETQAPLHAEYVIQPGDTLFEIGLRLNVQWPKLLEMNPSIRDEDVIFSGETILVPNTRT
ncbi:multifunctional 2',3'-cyclic-nucleotide 2'-phosphodiesterase/5'-nucleotidase/3'-nucleotidase [Shouchella clausii]|uniref:5'-nucleotidase C-terminal domain-containing protein n=1 Tax=Shouchella clausii TaxID=79880 RepID=UPI000BA5BFC5|nr:5'-nucleotidase C-terminal domain-containing protein [Shouchella clausii]MBU8597080.1 5'-nucleotidase C-terminal domain-containing protein [Shouchella clausii]MCY1104408.1 5'-nucleotidase C-terminal domain-containing protein [Shouchella clausii]PAD08729.1 multifunctional 2',3'-cyclic-nucleotide 2'-phosphodiesterase/5'-nucleotidase/3'-nucleotidase [Shouchella clausii]PAE82371.1 multifunctional 2',3'-cyclic-nucleotide 2'-phosphodiesterase/5'-nucleotidase/3'-nucleotidase [Shouchella clausii]PA